MSHITQLLRQIRSLPYVDMMVIAEELRAQLAEHGRQKVDAAVLAGILVRLQDSKLVPSDQTIEEEKVLREIFRVKRALSIQQRGDGWEINMGSVPGSQATSTELRTVFPMMLDQIITLHVLKK